MNLQLEKLSESERRQVERHKYFLSQAAGEDVGWNHALADWQEHYACQWRIARQARMLAIQREEILKHKWIESEKACQDVGKDAALDWIAKYAAQWRAWYDAEHAEDE